MSKAPDIPFNRARLMNIGYAEAIKDYDWDCMVFHDVDLVLSFNYFLRFLIKQGNYSFEKRFLWTIVFFTIVLLILDTCQV
jgi:hypothetical protein